MAKAFLAVILWLFVSFSVLAAAPQKKPPTWAELTQEQQQILAPLATDWDKLDAQRKRKWLGIAKRYPTMAAEEQANAQRNMQPWAKLTPEERRAARERYKKLQKLPPDKRQSLPQQWEEYQRLPEEQRKQLQAAGKAPKPVPKSPAKPSVPMPGPAPAAAK
jgi:hypothetical protein